MHSTVRRQQQQQTPAREFDDLFHGRVRFNVPINSLDGTYGRAQSIGHNRDYAIAIAISRARKDATFRLYTGCCFTNVAITRVTHFSGKGCECQVLRTQHASTYTTQGARTRSTYYCLYSLCRLYTYPTIRYVYGAGAYCSTRYICAKQDKFTGMFTSNPMLISRKVSSITRTKSVRFHVKPSIRS
uniref:Uncharacterized protein n=1 Tax=Trichogramma kaykai TaxID=54128 RepID=A0ABD2X6T3_9HYME